MSIKTISIEHFKKETYTGTVMLSGSFCEPCKKLQEKIEEEDFSEIHKIVIDTDDDDQIELSYNVFDMKKIPTLIKYESGVEITRAVGYNECVNKLFTFFTSDIDDDYDF